MEYSPYLPDVNGGRALLVGGSSENWIKLGTSRYPLVLIDLDWFGLVDEC